MTCGILGKSYNPVRTVSRICSYAVPILHGYPSPHDVPGSILPTQTMVRFTIYEYVVNVIDLIDEVREMLCRHNHLLNGPICRGLRHTANDWS